MTKILQGSNDALVITFDQDVSGLADISVSLWAERTGSPLKAWRKENVTIDAQDGTRVTCPLLEAESAAFPAGDITLEAKGLTIAGQVLFWERYPIKAGARFDRNIFLTQTG